MRSTPSIVCVAAAAVLALAACTPGGSGAPAPTAVASATPAPTARPTPAVSPSAPASPTAIAVECSADGIVPGRLGCLDSNLPVAGNPGEAALTWDPDHCSAGDGRFVLTASPRLVGLGGSDGGPIGRMDIYDASLTTAEGIHVGSTSADVAAAYPANPASAAFSGTQLVVLSGAEGFITIELADGWGDEPVTVANIRIYAAGQDPYVPVYGTEDFAGACPMDY